MFRAPLVHQQGAHNCIKLFLVNKTNRCT